MKTSLKYAFILGFVGFVTSFGAHIVAVNLPFYAERVGVSLFMIGVLIAAYDFAEIIAKPVFGALADKKGMKKTMLAGIIVFILASMLYPFIPPKLLLLVRFLQGLGAAALSAVSLAMVGTFYDKNRGKAFGIYNAIKGAGYVISPIVGGSIVLKSNFDGIFYASAGIGVIALLLSLFLPDRRKNNGEEIFDDDDFSFKGLLAVLTNRTLLPWFLVIVINMFFVGVLFGFLPVRIHALGYNAFDSGVLISVTSLAYLLIQPLAGWLADRMNIIHTLKFGMLLSCGATAFIPFAEGVWLITTCIIGGIGIGTVWTNSDTLVSKLSEDKRLGTTMGIAGSFKEFGDMIGPLLMGLISQTFNLSAGFITCAALGFISLLIISLKTKAKEIR